MNKHSIDYRRRLSLLMVLAFDVVILVWAPALMAQDPAAILEDSVIKVVDTCERSVVSIARFKPSPGDQVHEEAKNFILPRPMREAREVVDLQPNDFGAGCLISPPNLPDRLVLTNFHVVRGGPISPKFTGDDGTELLIKFNDRRGCRGSIIAADPRSDLAVLRLDWEKAEIKPTEFPSIKWETAAAPRKGQFVVLLGNPYAIARDGSASVSWGLISNLTRQPISSSRNQFLEQEDVAKGAAMLYRLGAVMQLDARLNLGLSGGPVLNLNGELIGISTSLAAIEGYEQSVGFALPIDSMTRRIIRTLLAGQEVEYGMLGIRPGDVGRKEFQGLDTGFKQQSAATVIEVTPGSPAHKAGIVAGDLIVEVEGKPVLSRVDLMRMVGLNPPESLIEVTVWRRDSQPSRLDKKVKLGKWPVLDDEGIIETTPRFAPWRGLSVDYPTARERFRDPSETRRVLITKVKANSPADSVQLQPGNFITHVNNAPVQTPAEFHAAVKKVSGTVEIKLLGEPQSSIPEIRKGRVVRIPETNLAE